MAAGFGGLKYILYILDTQHYFDAKTKPFTIHRSERMIRPKGLPVVDGDNCFTI